MFMVHLAYHYGTFPFSLVYNIKFVSRKVTREREKGRRSAFPKAYMAHFLQIFGNAENH